MSESTEEVTLYEAHPSMFRNQPVWFILMLGLTLAGIVLAFTVNIWLLILTGVGLVMFLSWWIKCLATKLIVTNHGTTLEKGLLSKSVNELWHNDVRNVQVDQTFFQRILGVGTIGVSSGGQAGIEITVNGIPNPQKVHELIEEQRMKSGQL